MKNNQSNESVVLATNHQAPWVKLWVLNWNYSHWLMTSIISTVLCSEIYSLLLSVYPNFLTSFWFNLGVTSSFIASALAISTVVLTGLISGWLIYSAHLAYYAFKTAKHDYQPLIELWNNFNHNHSELIDQLLTDQNFYDLSKFLQQQNLPEPINLFLANQQNIQKINKVMGLLKRIWQIEKVDEKIKALSVNILSEFSKHQSSQEHFDNIWNLCDMLLSKNEFTHENVIKSLQNSQQLKSYIPTLSQLSTHKDLLHKLIEEPKLMEFFLAAQEEFQGKDERINHNIDLLHLYMVNQFEKAENLKQFIASKHINATKATVSLLQFNWAKNFMGQPQQFIKLWDNLLHHPQLDWLDGCLEFMQEQPEKYNEFLLNFDSAQILTGLFNRLSSTQSLEFNQFSRFYHSLTENEDKGLFCEALFDLNHCQMLNESMIIELFIRDDWKQAANNLKRYIDKIWTKETSAEATEVDLKQFLVNPIEPEVQLPLQQEQELKIDTLPKSIEETPLPIEAPVKRKKSLFSFFRCGCSSSGTNSPVNQADSITPAANI